MGKQKRKFTPEDRLSILQECDREGQSVTLRKYNIAPSLLQRWKQKYLAKGMAGLKSTYHRLDPEKRALEEENERLKRIVSRQLLEIEFKTELLKHAQIDPLKKKK